MTSRCRWYGLAPGVQVGISALTNLMRQMPYSRRRGYGFKIETARRGSVSGEFIERVEWTESVDDGSGPVEVTRVDVRRVRFNVRSDAPEFEFIDPPRTLAPFFTALRESADETIAVVEYEVPPLEWLNSIERKRGSSTVTSITTSSFPATTAVAAVLTLTGTNDVRRQLEQFRGANRAAVERLTFTSMHEGSVLRCELHANGRATMLAGLDEDVGFLRDALRSTARLGLVSAG